MRITDYVHSLSHCAGCCCVVIGNQKRLAEYDYNHLLSICGEFLTVVDLCSGAKSFPYRASKEWFCIL